MTFYEFIQDLNNELSDNPDWADKEIAFATLTDSNLYYAAIYSLDDGRVNIDISNHDMEKINRLRLL